MANIHIPFTQLTPAEFLERPNRFVVHCRLPEQNQVVQAHLADPGRLKELLVPGALVYLKFIDLPHRKTKWSVVLVETRESKTLVSVQSTLVNQLSALALEEKAIPQFAAWNLVRSEYSLGNSRWDFLLEAKDGNSLILEVKSCSLVSQGRAMFPDAVTARGTRHVEELIKLQTEKGIRGAIMFVVQRGDATVFSPADHIDPKFGQALRQAADAGIKIAVYDANVSLTGVTWGKALSLELR